MFPFIISVISIKIRKKQDDIFWALSQPEKTTSNPQRFFPIRCHHRPLDLSSKPQDEIRSWRQAHPVVKKTPGGGRVTCVCLLAYTLATQNMNGALSRWQQKYDCSPSNIWISVSTNQNQLLLRVPDMDELVNQSKCGYSSGFQIWMSMSTNQNAVPLGSRYG